MMHLPNTISAKRLDGDPTLLSALVDLNNAHVQELSYVDAVRMRGLVSEAFIALAAGFADALLIAFDQGANYDSPNFKWFQSRFDKFIYVDRVVTSRNARNGGLAKALYKKLIECAIEAGQTRIVCEINSHPPNPVSAAFHRNLGFETIGSATLLNQKVVDYKKFDLGPGITGL